jgi:hypothetical protein
MIVINKLVYSSLKNLKFNNFKTNIINIKNVRLSNLTNNSIKRKFNLNGSQRDKNPENINKFSLIFKSFLFTATVR